MHRVSGTELTAKALFPSLEGKYYQLTITKYYHLE